MVSDDVRRFVEEFLRRRERAEGFDASRHSYYVPSVRRLFLQFLLTGHVVDLFYMSKEDVVTLGLLVSRDVYRIDPGFYVHAVKYARYLSLKKDAPLLALVSGVACGYDGEDLVRLLSTYTPRILVERFYNMFRYGTFPYRVEISRRRVRKLLARVIEEWEREGKLRWLAVKYPRSLRTLVRLVMDYVKIDSEVYDFLFYKGRNVTDPLLKARVMVREALRRREHGRAYELIVEHGLPFSLARPISYSLFDDRIFNIMSPYDIAMFCEALYRVARGERCMNPRVTVDGLVRAVERKGVKVPQWYIARTYIYTALRHGVDDPVAQAWAKVWSMKMVQTAEELERLGLGLERASIILVLDGSASMSPRERDLSRNILMQGLLCWVPFFRNVKSIVMFSGDAFYLEPDYVHRIDRIFDLLERAPNDGTCVECGLELALEEVKSGEYSHTVLITDEQANIISDVEYSEDHIASRVAEYCKLYIHNPQPYPAHVVRPRKNKIVPVYGRQAEDILVSVILDRLYELGEEEIIRLVEKTI